MKFKLHHDISKKTLSIPRAALQLSELADAEELILHIPAGAGRPDGGGKPGRHPPALRFGGIPSLPAEAGQPCGSRGDRQRRMRELRL